MCLVRRAAAAGLVAALYGLMALECVPVGTLLELITLAHRNATHIARIRAINNAIDTSKPTHQKVSLIGIPVISQMQISFDQQRDYAWSVVQLDRNNETLRTLLSRLIPNAPVFDSFVVV
jgi:hypothetical protein